MSPYRNFLDEARQRLARGRSVLSARASTLGTVRRLLPRGLRRELDLLERAIERPLRNPHDVELAQRSLAEYEERLEVAIAFSDHVVRDRRARWQQQCTWLRWLTVGAASAVFLIALMIVTHIFTPTPRNDDAAGACVLGSNVLGGSVAANDTAAANPCGLSVECARHGRCATGADGCTVSSSDDCRASWDCKIDGLCQRVADRCSAETDLDCAGSRECRLEGRCKAYGGQCLSVRDFAERAAPRPELAQSVRPSQ